MISSNGPSISNTGKGCSEKLTVIRLRLKRRRELTKIKGRRRKRRECKTRSKIK